MRKVICSAVVIVLAGTCWVVAQNAADYAQSPYGSVTMPAPISKPLPPVEKVELPAPPMPSELLVAPVTDLEIPMIPLPPPVAATVEASVGDIVVPPASADLAVTPPADAGGSPNVIVPVMAAESAPIVPQPFPAPTFPRQEERAPVRSTIRPAVATIPALPPVPGVAADTTGVPGYAMPPLMNNTPPASSNSAPPLAYPNGAIPPSMPPANSPTSPQPPIWTVDGPGIFTADSPGRILGPSVWASTEYLMWFVKPMPVPALVREYTGVQLGQTLFPASQIVDLLPGDKKEINPLNGVRGTIGFWLNQSQTLGFETSYFWFGQSGVNDTFQAAPGSILGRPFFNVAAGQSDIFPVATPGGLAGSIHVQSAFHAEGGDASLLANSFGTGPNVNFIAGVRYLDVTEKLRIDQQTSLSDGSFASSGYDYFGTQNQFFGGQVGLRWRYEGARLFASMTAKIAYGVMEEHVRIDGASALDAFGNSMRTNGNLLALPTNIGSYNRSRMAFIPEALASVGYKFTPWASGFVGYNFMYVSNLVRPGKQIDTVIDPTNFPFQNSAANPASPSFHFRQESLWMQGINVGLTLRY